MFNFRFTAITTAFLFLGCMANSCEAQNRLMDWLRGTPRGYGYTSYYRGPQPTPSPGGCVTTCPKTCYQTVNRVVANYVPYTAFRTEWYRVPVTYYRPVTSSNPRTGCVTTCMRPCTYYQMQARRVPYTTYQTVYRTVQHRIPYTVYETSYGTGCSTCSPCSTCGVNGSSCATCGVNGGSVVSGNMVPSGTVQNYGLNPNTQYAPANTVPQLTPGSIQPDTTLQKPETTTVVEPQADPTVNTEKSSHVQPQLNVPQNPAPVVDDSNRTASLVRGKWDYSPVRPAAYFTASDSTSVNTPMQATASVKQSQPFSKPSGPAFRSPSWKSVQK